MLRMLFRNYPFLWVALVLFIVVSIVGIVKEGFIVGVVIGLAVSFISIILIVSAVYAIICGNFLLDSVGLFRQCMPLPAEILCLVVWKNVLAQKNK